MTPSVTNGMHEKENVTPGMLVKLDAKATDMETRRILAFSPQVSSAAHPVTKVAQRIFQVLVFYVRCKETYSVVSG